MNSSEKVAGVSQPDVSPASRLLMQVDRRRWWLFGLIVALHIVAFNGQWRISPDSALYSELGRNLAEGRGFTYQGEPHTWVEPGLPYAIRFSFKEFGVDYFSPLMLAMMACSLLALMLTYTLFTLHVGRPTAVLVAGLLGLSETFFRYGYHLFTDMPFLVGVLAFLVGYELILLKRHHLHAWGLVIGATLFMVAFRPAVITFVGAVGLTCAWHVIRGPGRIRHVILGVVVLACFIGFKEYADPRRDAAPGGETHRESMLKSLLSDKLGYAVKRMATEWIPMLLEESTTEAIFGTRLGPGVSSVAAIGIIAAGVLLARQRVLWGVWVAATVAQMAFWLPRERYFLPILPLLLYAMWNAGGWLSRKLPFRWRDAVPVIIVILLVVPNCIYIAKFIIEQRRTPFLAHYEKGEKLELIALAQKLRESITPEATIVADQGRELSYFSELRVIDPPTERRVALTQADFDEFRDKLAKDRAVFVVLPGKNVETLIQRIHAEVGDAITSHGERTVYRLELTATRATMQP
jgi:hypothetical protein